MSIFEIGQNQTLSGVTLAQTALDRSGAQLSSGRKINSAADDPVIWAKAQQDTIAFKGLQGINDNLIQTAGSISIADSAMGTIGQYLGLMKGQLDAIIKNYPPFPPGSQDRIKYLRMFNGLRAQIDALSMPDDKGAQQIMANQTTAPGNWTVQVGQNGTTVTVQKQEIHTGPTGLNIPALPDTTTDAEVAAASANLDTAQQVLANRRAGLGADAATISRTQDFNTAASTVQQVGSEKWTIADLTEAGAAQKSADLRSQLAFQAVGNLTDMRTQLLALFK